METTVRDQSRENWMIRIALVGCGRIAKRHSELLGRGEIPGAELVLVEDCGHLSTMECPEEINAALRKWMTC